MWSGSGWRQTLQYFSNQGTLVVLTGLGKRDLHSIREILKPFSGGPSIVNLCNKLSFSEFRGIILEASGLVSIETVAMHIASERNVPTIALFSERSDPNIWGPSHSRSIVLSPAKEISPDQMIAAISNVAQSI